MPQPLVLPARRCGPSYPGPCGAAPVSSRSRSYSFRRPRPPETDSAAGMSVRAHARPTECAPRGGECRLRACGCGAAAQSFGGRAGHRGPPRRARRRQQGEQGQQSRAVWVPVPAFESIGSLCSPGRAFAAVHARRGCVWHALWAQAPLKISQAAAPAPAPAAWREGRRRRRRRRNACCEAGARGVGGAHNQRGAARRGRGEGRAAPRSPRPARRCETPRKEKKRDSPLPKPAANGPGPCVQRAVCAPAAAARPPGPRLHRAARHACGRGKGGRRGLAARRRRRRRGRGCGICAG
jgi:hypothetical protein